MPQDDTGMHVKEKVYGSIRNGAPGQRPNRLGRARPVGTSAGTNGAAARFGERQQLPYGLRQ